MERLAILVVLGTLAPACSSECEHDAVTITSREVWRGRTCRIRESLVIEGDGELLLEDATIAFDPAVEDTDAFQLHDRARFHAERSTLESANDKQWNLQAYDDAVVELVDTTATEHTGLRNFDRVRFTASGADVEEVQVHDDTVVRLDDGAAGYVVLFFTGGVVVELQPGELVVGEGQARTLALPTGPATTGTLELADADVYGWQIDLENDSSVTVTGGEEIVLALHLTDVSATIADDLTTSGPSTGVLDFADQGGPRFAYTDSTLASFNVYAAGASQIAFTGQVDVTEPNAEGTSRLLFAPGTTLYANLAQTYEQAEMTFDGVKLAIDGEDGSSPSFTADDQSTITIIDVVAIDGTYLGAVGEGRVLVQGGSAWDVASTETIDVDGAGGVFKDGVPF